PSLRPTRDTHRREVTMSTPRTPTTDTDTMIRRDGYLPPDEAARDLGCGKRWPLVVLNRHGFPHSRVGRAKWLSPEDREEIRKLSRVPAEPAKIARLHQSMAKAQTPTRNAACKGN